MSAGSEQPTSSADDGSIVGQLPPYTWSDEESVSYEAAVEAINEVVGACSARIADERAKAEPDASAIATWSDERRRCHELRQRLDPTDHEQIARVRRESAERAVQLRQH